VVVVSSLPDVVALTQELIRFDTSNPPGGERGAIEHLVGVLERAGADLEVVARDPERPNLIARIEGRGEAPGLLMQGHVDVVPASPPGWSHPPFSGRIADGFVWGRGAIDMKGSLAQMAVVFAELAASGRAPDGDVVLAALSDEEQGSEYGARFVVDQHPELLDGLSFAIGEFGAFSTEILGRRFYPVQVSEKQWCTVRVSVSGRGGHGSVPVRGEAMARLATVLAELDSRRLPFRLTAIPAEMIEGVAAQLPEDAASHLRRLLDPAQADEVLDAGGSALGLFDAALHNTVAPTRLQGSSRVDAIPSRTSIELDGRVLPGSSPDELIEQVREVCGEGVEVELLEAHQPAIAHPDMTLFDVLADAISDVDPDGVAVPMLLPGMTDARFLGALGIQCYGFTPLRLPGDLPLGQLIHGVDERVPVQSLRFGVEVLRRLVERMGQVEA
jgi:acetylornithine deacetylase/succinyl-diaminopimelate desuccinylase-like protein